MNFEKIITCYKNTALTDEEVEVLKANNYRFDEMTPARIKYNVDMILYMLKVDPGRVDVFDSGTLNALKNADEFFLYRILKLLDDNYIPYDHIHHAALYNIAKNYREPDYTFISLAICRNIKNCNLRTTKFEKIKKLNELAWNWENVHHYPEERELVIRALISNKIPASVLPNLILTDPDVIKAYTSKLGAYKQENIMNILTSTQYTEENEIEFCAAYGCESVEEYIDKKMFRYTAKEPEDIEQLAAIKIYTQKLLFKHKIPNSSVYLNAYPDDLETFGYVRDNDIYLSTYPTRSYDEMVLVTAHETFHAIQKYLAKTLRIDLDPDVDTYTKDDFLRDYYSSTEEMDYYQENYSNITSEYDAEYRARIESYNIENPVDTDTQFEELRTNIEERLEEEKEILRGLSRETAYSYTRTRLNEYGDRVHLDDLVEEKLIETREQCQSFEEFIKGVNEIYPMLAYEFYLSEDDIHKKSPQELLNDLLEAKDERTRKVYEGLISSSMTPQKSKNHMDNVIFFQGVINDPNIPEDIKEAIALKLEESAEDKYLGLVNVDI